MSLEAPIIRRNDYVTQMCLKFYAGLVAVVFSILIFVACSLLAMKVDAMTPWTIASFVLMIALCTTGVIYLCCWFLHETCNSYSIGSRDSFQQF